MKAGEIGFDPTQAQGALAMGLDVLDQASDYEFTAYTRTVLPVDGYVFWTPTSKPLTASGSLHYALETVQNPDEVAGDGDIIFTSKSQISQFGQPGTRSQPSMLYVITVGENQTNDPDQNPVRFAFNRQGHFYAQAGLWHYAGRRVMPALATQLLDPGNTIDLTRAITSNSLPIWLSMNTYQQSYSGAPTTPGVTIYPADMVAENLVPPYAVVDIVDTSAIGSAPLLNGAQFGYHTQLCRDVVDVTLYGLQNNEALAFQDFVNQFSVDTDDIGIMNMPVVSDSNRRTAPEIKTTAMKKTIRYEISYYQSVTTSAARQMIAAATPAFIVNPNPTF